MGFMQLSNMPMYSEEQLKRLSKERAKQAENLSEQEINEIVRQNYR